MEYTEAKLGRIFTIRFDKNEDILEELKKLIIKENIRTGLLHMIGAISNTEIVLGPQEKQYPPDPFYWSFDDAKELLGVGIFAWDNNEPKLHIHSGLGNHKDTKIGCIRKKSEVYLTIECIMFEFIDTNIYRKFNEKYNAFLLDFKK